MKIVNCDKCNNEFKYELLREDIGQNITKVYFKCPKCGQEYLVHYSTVLIEQKQHKIRGIIKAYENARGVDPLKAATKFKEYQRLKKQIGRDMDNLQRRVDQWKLK